MTNQVISIRGTTLISASSRTDYTLLLSITTLLKPSPCFQMDQLMAEISCSSVQLGRHQVAAARLACIPARACCVTFHQGPIFDQSGHAFRYRQKLLHIRSNTLLLPCLSWIRLLNLFLVSLVPTTYLEKSGKPGRYLSREIFASDFI